MEIVINIVYELLVKMIIPLMVFAGLIAFILGIASETLAYYTEKPIEDDNKK